jgi:REP element-mobilizing transposase RayT
MNRGIARRTLFEHVQDSRRFLAALALVVRSGLLEVHCYCFMPTHFHLLVRSPDGDLSRSMSLVQNAYSRWFNRSRRRDGPLYRSRFRSKRVDGLTYRRHLVRYIDHNPVSAGLVNTPALYPLGSARAYLRPRGPIWLSRDWIEPDVIARMESAEYEPEHYQLLFGQPLSTRLHRLVEKRIAHADNEPDPLDDLLAAAPLQVLEWMRRKAALADGTQIGMPLCDAEDVEEILRAAERSEGRWELADKRSTSAWPLARTALLREISACSWGEVGARTGTTASGAWKRYARHQSCLELESEYSRRIARLAAESLQAGHR